MASSQIIVIHINESALIPEFDMCKHVGGSEVTDEFAVNAKVEVPRPLALVESLDDFVSCYRRNSFVVSRQPRVSGVCGAEENSRLEAEFGPQKLREVEGAFRLCVLLLVFCSRARITQ